MAGFGNNIFPAVYFWVISKNWVYLFNFWMLGLWVPMFVVKFFFFESPVHLYEKKRYDKLRKVMARIAWVNGKTLPEYDLEAELEERDTNVRQS